MHIFLDIDGTISTAGINGTIAAYALACDFSPERKAEALALGDSTQVASWPEVVALRERHGETALMTAVKRAALTPQVIFMHEAFPGAQAGAMALSQLGSLIYATGRSRLYSGEDEHQRSIYAQLNGQALKATCRWLAQHEFPCSSDVLFVSGSQEKIALLADYVMVTEQEALLIDDVANSLCRAALRLPSEKQEALRRYMTLVVYGESDPIRVAAPPFRRILTLSDWSQASLLISQLEDANVA